MKGYTQETRIEFVPTEIYCDFCGRLIKVDTLTEYAMKQTDDKQIHWKRTEHYRIRTRFNPGRNIDPKETTVKTFCCHNCLGKVFNAFISKHYPDGTIRIDAETGMIPVPEDTNKYTSSVKGTIRTKELSGVAAPFNPSED